LEKAGKILVEMLDENPNAFRDILREHPELTPGGLNDLELIGRGQLLPEAALDTSAAGRRLRKLPISQQRIAYTGTIDVVTQIGDKVMTERKAVAELTTNEAARAISNTRIVPPKQQEEALASRRKAKEEVHLPYKVEGFKVHFRKGTVIVREELEAILKLLPETNGKGLEKEMKRRQVANA